GCSPEVPEHRQLRALRGLREATTVTDMTFQLTPEEQGLASRFDIAFAHCGIAWSDRRFQCPHCGPSAEPKKTKIFSDGGCICYKCRWGARDAYGILYRWSEERGRKYSFREAKAILMGFDPDSGKLVVSAETLAEVPQIED